MTLIRLNVVSRASHSSKKSHAAAHSSRPHLLQPRVKHHFNEPDWLRSPCDVTRNATINLSVLNDMKGDIQVKTKL